MCKLDFKVGWKKLKEVFSIAGTVKRADIKEDKDGKSRGMGTVTFEQAIEAVQAICILGFGGKKKDQIWIGLYLRLLTAQFCKLCLLAL